MWESSGAKQHLKIFPSKTQTKLALTDYNINTRQFTAHPNIKNKQGNKNIAGQEWDLWEGRSGGQGGRGATQVKTEEVGL